MDDDLTARAQAVGPQQRQSQSALQPAQGGAVEPANAKERQRGPQEGPAERYELRDPVRELTYRVDSFSEVTAKAAQLGATRFTAIAADGTRTPIRKVGDEWQRGDSLPALLKPPPDLATHLDNFPDLPIDPLADPARSPRQDKTGAKALAKIDAQAERAAMVARIESSLADRYIIKRAPITLGDMTIGSTEYRFRGDSSRVAFTESNQRLTTDINSPSVARSMVDLAQARGWKGLRVSGSDDFRRMVWLEASIRGVKAIGYEPNLGDLQHLRREHELRQTNRIEPTHEAASAAAAAPAGGKPSARGGGRKAVIAAMDAILTEKKVPEAKRLAVLAAAEKQLAQMARNGHVPKVKVYDRNAERQVQIAPTAADLSRQQDRTGPTHTR